MLGNFQLALLSDMTISISSITLLEHALVVILVFFSTGCPTKNYTLFWRAVSPLNFELGIKVGGVLASSGSQL